MADLGIIYDTSTGRMTIKKLAAAQIESLDAAVITSGLIPVARISGLPHANLALSGMVDAHDIISLDAAKITSGLLAPARVSGLPYANLNLADSIVAGDIKSGAIGTSELNAGAVTEAILGTGAVVSAKIGASAIGNGHIHDLDASKIDAGLLAPARVSGLPYANLALSGQVDETDLKSGLSIDIAEMQHEPSFKAFEPIAAFDAVCFRVSGHFGVACAGDASAMPAFGVARAAIASGDPGIIALGGRITNTGWDFSGYIGSLVFTGVSGEVTRTPPSTSGNIQQRLGQVVAPDTVLLFPTPYVVEIAA